MSTARCRATFSRYASAAVTRCIVLASSLLALAACATAEAADGADAASNVIIPVGDSDDGGARDAAQNVDAEAAPCAVGNLCRVPTALSFGGVTAMNGRSKNDVWASGVDVADGVLIHWDGQQWSKLDFDVQLSDSSNPYRPGALLGIFLSPEAMWGAIDGNAIFRRELELAPGRVAFSNLSSYNAIMVDVAAVLEREDVYLIGRKYQTKTTRPLFGFNFETGTLDNLPGPFFPGTNEEAELTIRASFFVPNKALWLVGDQGAVARYPMSSTGDGGAAASAFGRGVVLPVPSHTDLRAAWGHGEELWAAGRNGALLHFDGAEWRTEETGTRAMLNAIFGVSPNDIWAVGEAGTVLHFDGNTWSPVGVGGYSGNLKAIWGSASDDVWIGGEGGMFHWGALQ